MKEKMRNSKTETVYWRLSLYIKQCCCIAWNVEKIQKAKIQKL